MRYTNVTKNINMKNTITLYRHVRLDTNEVFYVGIGKATRPSSKHNRNK